MSLQSAIAGEAEPRWHGFPGTAWEPATKRGLQARQSLAGMGSQAQPGNQHNQHTSNQAVPGKGLS
ncbi:MAG: hypothetical protein MUE44_27540 [Oscillatoriaceae cyanobacterium Prado104]|nr:hypothetical protein [Oscillatoriaceae cyanobacterium Prado104]